MKRKSQVQKRILVVDDLIAITETIKDSLEFHGYNIQTANNIGEAIIKAKSSTFDLLITDKNLECHRGVLPLLDYFQENCPETKVLICSAEDGARARQELYCHDYHDKSAEYSDFLAKIERLLV